MASCDYNGLNEVAEKANSISKSKEIEMITEIAKAFPDIKKQTRSGLTYGGKKRRSKKGGANNALVHTICLMMIGAAGYGSFYVGVAAATRLGYFNAAQRLYDYAASAVQGCGDLASGLARGQAQRLANTGGIELGPISCSKAWSQLETAETRLTELVQMYGTAATSAGVSITVAGYGRLYSFVDTTLNSCSRTPIPVEENPATGGTRRRRRTYKKRTGGARRGGARGSCGMNGGKKRKSRGRKSRGRKSRGRKSRGRKSRGRKSRGRKSRRHRR